MFGIMRQRSFIHANYVKVVSQEKYEAWLDGAIKEYAGLPRSVQVADANMNKVLEVEASNN